MQGRRADGAVKETVLDWLRAQNPLARKAYVPSQLDVYRRISAALKADKAVAAGTTKNLPGSSDGKGFSGGESKVAGMVATHAYAVLRVREDAKGRLWILIRNPWGEGFFFGYGRAYDEVETKEGTVFRPKKTGSADRGCISRTSAIPERTVYRRRREKQCAHHRKRCLRGQKGVRWRTIALRRLWRPAALRPGRPARRSNAQRRAPTIRCNARRRGCGRSPWPDKGRRRLRGRGFRERCEKSRRRPGRR